MEFAGFYNTCTLYMYIVHKRGNNMALHWWTVENTLYNCSNINRLASSPPVTLDDHSDAITNVMKLSDLNKCPHLIDLIQTTDHITLITTGKKRDTYNCTCSCNYICTCNCNYICIHRTASYHGKGHQLHTTYKSSDLHCLKAKLKYMYMYLIILCCIDC